MRSLSVCLMESICHVFERLRQDFLNSFLIYKFSLYNESFSCRCDALVLVFAYFHPVFSCSSYQIHGYPGFPWRVFVEKVAPEIPFQGTIGAPVWCIFLDSPSCVRPLRQLPLKTSVLKFHVSSAL